MKFWWTMTAVGAGAIAISLANTLLHLAFLPRLTSDGQYVFIYFLFVPQGAWLGGFTGLVLASIRNGTNRSLGITLLVGGGMFLIAAEWYLLDSLLSDASQSRDTIASFFLFFGLALLWAFALILWGIYLLIAAPRTA